MKNVLKYFLTLKEKKLEPHWVFQQFFLFVLGEGSIITPTGKVGHFARLRWFNYFDQVIFYFNNSDVAFFLGHMLRQENVYHFILDIKLYPSQYFPQEINTLIFDQVFHINYESNKFVPASCTTVWIKEIKNPEPK